MQAVRSVGLDRLKRFVCLLLIFVLIFCFFMCPRASAVAVEAATVAYAGALVGTILVGAGVIFSSHGDMQKVGAAMYKSWVKSSNAIGSKISAIAAWAVEHGEAAAKGALRVGKELYQGIIDAFKVTYSSDDKTFSIPSGLDLAYDGDASKFEDWLASISCKSQSLSVVDAAGNHFDFDVLWYNNSWYGRLFINGSQYDFQKVKSGYWNSKSYAATARMYYFHSWGTPVMQFDVHLQEIGSTLSVDQTVITVRAGSDDDDVFKIVKGNTFTSGYSVPVAADASSVAYPSDNALVRMPDLPTVDDIDDTISWPSDAAYTKDAVSVPYPTDADGVKVPDIPYDQVVDQSTGKALDDTGTGTDTGTDTDNPSKPGEDTDTDNPSDSVNWPSAGDISLPKLIISKFPFCIPFDVADMIALLETDPKAPVFKMPIKVGSIVNEEISLDLEQYSDVIRIIRWGELLLFVAGLAYVTRNYIKW